MNGACWGAPGSCATRARGGRRGRGGRVRRLLTAEGRGGTAVAAAVGRGGFDAGAEGRGWELEGAVEGVLLGPVGWVLGGPVGSKPPGRHLLPNEPLRGEALQPKRLRPRQRQIQRCLRASKIRFRGVRGGGLRRRRIHGGWRGE